MAMIKKTEEYVNKQNEKAKEILEEMNKEEKEYLSKLSENDKKQGEYIKQINQMIELYNEDGYKGNIEDDFEEMKKATGLMDADKLSWKAGSLPTLHNPKELKEYDKKLEEHDKLKSEYDKWMKKYNEATDPKAKADAYASAIYADQQAKKAYYESVQIINDIQEKEFRMTIDLLDQAYKQKKNTSVQFEQQKKDLKEQEKADANKNVAEKAIDWIKKKLK